MMVNTTTEDIFIHYTPARNWGKVYNGLTRLAPLSPRRPSFLPPRTFEITDGMFGPVREGVVDVTDDPAEHPRADHPDHGTPTHEWACAGP